MAYLFYQHIIIICTVYAKFEMIYVLYYAADPRWGGGAHLTANLLGKNEIK